MLRGTFCAAAAVLIASLFATHAVAHSLTAHAKHEQHRHTELAADGSTALSGKALAKCDRSGVHDPKFPTTGWRRGDMCTAESSDAGSHFVCVNMPNDFWVNTGQASSAADAAANWPKPGPWCICMWAYADYLSKEPAFADDVICDATKEWVLAKYDKKVATQCAALMSLCKHCNLASSVCPTDC